MKIYLLRWKQGVAGTLVEKERLYRTEVGVRRSIAIRKETDKNYPLWTHTDFELFEIDTPLLKKLKI